MGNSGLRGESSGAGLGDRRIPPVSARQKTKQDVSKMVYLIITHKLASYLFLIIRLCIKSLGHKRDCPSGNTYFPDTTVVEGLLPIELRAEITLVSS